MRKNHRIQRDLTEPWLDLPYAKELEAIDDLHDSQTSRAFMGYGIGDKIPSRSTVASTEKVLSIFENHTDVTRKDRRETHYGHKICLTGGASSLILDCVVLEGNPADSTLALDAVKRQEMVYGRPGSPNHCGLHRVPQGRDTSSPSESLRCGSTRP